MEVLSQALAQQRPIRLHAAAGEGYSVAGLVPIKRSATSVAFGALGAGSEASRKCLRISASGRTDLHGGKNGPWTEFSFEPGEESNGQDGAALVLLRSVKSGRWLTVVGGEFASAQEPTPLLPELVSGSLEPSAFAPEAAREAPAAVLPVDTGVLSAADLVHFREKGYVVVRDAVPRELVRDALRSINHQLGKPDCWQADDDPLNAAQLRLKLPKDVGPDILNKSPVFWSAINILLGVGNVEPWKQGCQVALRFPQPPQKGHETPDQRPGTHYHIDGMGGNQLCPFSLLCGVALSDQTRPEMGNLHVFPGSHLHEGLHSYYREKIDDDDQNEADDTKPDLGQSVQVSLRPGDVVLAHQLTAHRVGINTSENIRYQLYYRVKHKCHAELKNGILDDPWLEFGELLRRA